VRLIEADEALDAMLLERCEPGTPLSKSFQPDQDFVIAGLLKQFWRPVPDDSPFRPLSTMITSWMEETRESENAWHDTGLVGEGLDIFDELLSSSLGGVLLATDLHAGNVLKSQREGWLVIDPKPFIGERAYDATQHLLQSRPRLRSDGLETIRRMADLLEVDFERVRLWTFARLAAEPRDDWDDEPTELAAIIGSG
jgi:streptomycin 6-kinase